MEKLQSYSLLTALLKFREAEGPLKVIFSEPNRGGVGGVGWDGVCTCACVCFGRVVIGRDETKGPHGVIQRDRCSRVSRGARVG